MNPTNVIIAVLIGVFLIVACIAAILLMLGWTPTVGLGS